MAARAMNFGSYPRPDSLVKVLKKSLGLQKHPKARPGPEVSKAYDRALAEVVREQKTSGVAWVTDGQLKWDDGPVSLCARLKGIEMGGLIRFADNNFYYRRPRIRGAVSWSAPAFAADAKSARRSAPRVKGVLPGPVTLARYSEDHHYGSVERVARAYAEALKKEAASLERAGAKLLQFDEPALAANPKDLDLARLALAPVLKGRKATTLVSLYFGKPTQKVLSGLLEMAGGVVVDATSDGVPLPKMEGRVLALGCVNGRNTKMEDPAAVRARVQKIAAKAKPAELLITSSCGLEFIPRAVAKRKLVLLSRVAKGVS
ncbi:MAG: hypothetical protein QXO51_05050 [Halobacteria archaeon]